MPQGALFLVDLKQNTSREGASVLDGRDFARAAASGGANCGSSFCQAREIKTGGCCLPSHFGGPAQNTPREGASVLDGCDFARAAASGGAN